MNFLNMDPVAVLGQANGTAAKSPPPPAVIRPFTSSTDLKIVRYLVGASIMEPSSVANQTALWTAPILVLWAIMSHLLVSRFSSGWPTFVSTLFHGDGLAAAWASKPLMEGFTQWLSVAPILVAPPIVLLALFEMRHRNMFEDEMTRAIGDEDMRDIEGYYATGAGAGKSEKSGKSVALADGADEGGRKGFWVLEYDGRIIGAMGLDGRKPGKGLDSIVDAVPESEDAEKDDSGATASASTTAKQDGAPYSLRNRKGGKADPTITVTAPSPLLATSSLPATYTDTVHLRRFATSLSFRPTGIEDDLLMRASACAFGPTPARPAPAKYMTIAVRPTVQKPLVARLVAMGFRPVEKGSEREVGMEDWKKAQVGGGVTAMAQSVLAMVWPLDLGWTTYELSAEQWRKSTKA